MDTILCPHKYVETASFPQGFATPNENKPVIFLCIVCREVSFHQNVAAYVIIIPQRTDNLTNCFFFCF